MVYEKHAVGASFIFLLSGLFLFSCGKNESFPSEPTVTFKDFIIQGDSAQLIFEFTDGDGNIGLEETDILPPFNSESYYHYNLYIRYFEKNETNQWNPGITAAGDTVIFRYRVKPFVLSANSKGIKGTMEVSLSPFFYNPFSVNNGVIKYTIELIDRDLNKSNIEETPEIIR
jgi:hypothetical protein